MQFVNDGNIGIRCTTVYVADGELGCIHVRTYLLPVPADMVTYHSQNPITILGDERLQHPCPCLNVPAVFQGLLGNKW
jgi:hypothetical protein